MNSNKQKSYLYPILAIPLLLVILFVATYFVQSALADVGHPSRNTSMVSQGDLQTDETVLVFLPLMLNRFPPKLFYGVELLKIIEDTGLELILKAGSKWSRSGRVAWMDVQPEEGIEPNWAALADSELQWVIAAEKGLKNIVIVDSTPYWAQLIDGYSCGPIIEDKLDAFASFMYKLVRRYSQPPWNIKHWELWNEPDVSHTLVEPDATIGCWGDEFDENYGGGYYAEMMKRVYPAVKSADPAAKVLVGGLLLDCDPRIWYACGDGFGGHGDLPPKFLRGILSNGGKDFFDGISFHSYEYYFFELGVYANPRWVSEWNRTGPVMLAKLDYITELLTEFNAANKSLYSTENGLLSYCVDDHWPTECGTQETFELTKAYYVAQTYAVASRAVTLNRLQMNNWWSIYGWKESGLLKSIDNTPLPAYFAYSFSAAQLQRADYQRDIIEYTGVMGYEFRMNSSLIWIIWSLDGETHDLQLPSIPTAGYHVDGEILNRYLLNGISLKVTREPIYVRWE